MQNNALLRNLVSMQRAIHGALDAWLERPRRRAMVIRGARQVGKTWLVRDLAARHRLDLIELNFEREPGRAALFDDRGPAEVLRELGLLFGRSFDAGTSLLFLDEIQAVPRLLSKLRWFTEELPQLAVVAAGSLLEFALSNTGHSVPVGRVTYRYVEPMTFEEVLQARGEEQLLEELRSWSPGAELSPAAHERASRLYERFAMVGGMPAVVQADLDGEPPETVRRMQSDLAATYREDFARYATRLDPELLDRVLVSVSFRIGEKLVYSRLGEGLQHRHVKEAVELLAKARLLTLVPHSVADGIPLAGAADPRKRKAVFLDVGLVHAMLRTPAAQAFPSPRDLAPGIRGRLAEQLAGQCLRQLHPSAGDEPTLHYWQRGGGRLGEVDYLIEVDQRVVPVELKAGATGSMKSLHQFMQEKGFEVALRSDTNPPSVQDVAVETTQGQPVRFRLLSLPGYLLWRAADTLRELIRKN